LIFIGYTQKFIELKFSV